MIKEQERVKETSLVSGRVTVAATEVAGGELEDERTGPGGSNDCGEWSPGWPGRYAMQCAGPPYSG